MRVLAGFPFDFLIWTRDGIREHAMAVYPFGVVRVIPGGKPSSQDCVADLVAGVATDKRARGGDVVTDPRLSGRKDLESEETGEEFKDDHGDVVGTSLVVDVDVEAGCGSRIMIVS